MKRELFPIDRIVIGDRLREIVPSAVALLEASIKTEGLIHPIVLRRLPDGTARLVVGRHRLEAHKRLKLDTIAVEWMPLTGDEIEDDITEKIMEVDENLYRAELGQAGVDLHVGKRVLLTNERVLTRDLRKNAEKKDELREALEAAPTPVEKKKIATAVENLSRNDRRLVETAKAFGYERHAEQDGTLSIRRVNDLQVIKPPVSPHTPKTPHRIPSTVIDEVQKETGMERIMINKSNMRFGKLGPDVLAMAERIDFGGGSKAGTQAELVALCRLKDEYLKEFEGVIRTWRNRIDTGKGRVDRPSTVLAGIIMKQKDDEKASKMGSPVVALEEMLSRLSKIKNDTIEVQKYPNSIRKHVNLKTMPEEFRRIVEKIASIETLSRAILKDLKTKEKEAHARAD